MSDEYQEFVEKCQEMYSRLKEKLEEYLQGSDRKLSVEGVVLDFDNTWYLRICQPNGSVFCNVELVREFIYDHEIEDVDQIIAQEDFRQKLKNGEGKRLQILSDLTIRPTDL